MEVGLGDGSREGRRLAAVSQANGARGGTIDAIEMVESDFAANPVKAETQETDVAAEYEKITPENKVTKTLKEQDVKYKNQELKRLSTKLTELISDEKVVKTTKPGEKKESKLTKNDQLEVLKNKIKDLHETFDSLGTRTPHGRVG